MIMVVEDEPLLLKAITQKLTIQKLDPVSFASGQEAIEYLENNSRLPDVVWLDYYLKDMNGIEFVHKLKANSKWEHIPVVVVSNSASPQKVHSLLALGADKYLLKAAYRLEEIIEITKQFIKK